MLETWLFVLVLFGIIFFNYISVSRKDVVSLVALYFYLVCISQILKRAIFNFGSVDPNLYYFIQVVPTGLMVALFLYVIATRPRHLKRAEVAFSVAFMGYAILVTLFQAGGSSIVARIGALVVEALPLMFVAIGAALRPEDVRYLARRLRMLALLAVGYAAFQLVVGPELIDGAWATEAQLFSVSALKTHAYMTGVLEAFRPYSFYSDPFEYGMNMVYAFVFAALIVQVSGGSSSRIVFWAGVFLFGAALSLSRSPVGGLLVILLTRMLFLVPFGRNMAVVTAVILLGIFGVVDGANYLLGAFGNEIVYSQDPLIARAVQVGTLSDRTSALEALETLIVTEPRLFGSGYGTDTFFSAKIGEAQQGNVLASSHNLIVDIILNVGLIGAILYFCFIFAAIRSLLRTVRAADKATANVAVWLLAAIVGTFAMGYVSGSAALGALFYLIVGIAARLHSETADARAEGYATATADPADPAYTTPPR